MSANVSVSDEWITVAMDFSPGIPEYKTQILIAPDRLEIIFLDTKIADKALADGGRVGKFPLSEIAPYQGSLNASLSFHLAYEADPVIGTSEKTLTVSFPRKAFYYREIALVTPC